MLGTRDYGLEVAPPLTGASVRTLPSVGVRVVALGVLAGLSYLSWPLGYVLTPGVVGVGLASDLEVSGQPFAWLFISLDIVSGALMILVAAALWARPARRPLLAWAILGYALFGVSTAVSAAVPLSCGVGRAALLACGTSPSSYGFHDAISVVGYLALFVSLLGCLSCSRKAQGRSGLWVSTAAIGALWAGSGLAFLSLTLAGLPEVACQHLLLVATSAAIALFPYTMHSGVSSSVPEGMG